MGIVLTSFDRALPAPPFRLRRDTIPPHDPSGPFADHPCVRFTRLPHNDSVTRRRKSYKSCMEHLCAFGTPATLCSPVTAAPYAPFTLKDDEMSAYRTVTG